MRKLRTEGGWLFVVLFAALFGAVGMSLFWGAIVRGEDTLLGGVVFVGSACLVLFLSAGEIRTAFDLWRESEQIHARVERIEENRRSGKSGTRVGWYVVATGRYPDGSPGTFRSARILTDPRGSLSEGSLVPVDVAPRTHRYRVNLDAIEVDVEAPAVPPAIDAGFRGIDGRPPAGAKAGTLALSNLPFASAFLIGGIWFGLTFYDGRFMAYAWIVVPVLVGLFFLSVILSVIAALRRAGAAMEAFQPRSTSLTGGSSAERLGVGRVLTIAAAGLALAGFLFQPLFGFAIVLFIAGRAIRRGAARQQAFEGARAAGATVRFPVRVVETILVTEGTDIAERGRWRVRADGTWPDGTPGSFFADSAAEPTLSPGDTIAVDGDPATRRYALLLPNADSPGPAAGTWIADA